MRESKGEKGARKAKGLSLFDSCWFFLSHWPKPALVALGSLPPACGERFNSVSLQPWHLFAGAEMSSMFSFRYETAIAPAKKGLAAPSSTSAGPSERSHSEGCLSGWLLVV